MKQALEVVVNLGRVFDQHRHDAGHDEHANQPFDHVVQAVFEFGVKKPMVYLGQPGFLMHMCVIGHGDFLVSAPHRL
jgi:hypothetical protein